MANGITPLTFTGQETILMQMQLSRMCSAWIVPLSVFPSSAAAGIEVTRSALQMGTYSDVTVLAPTRAAGLELAGVALEAIARVEDELSTWRPSSEISAINRAPIGCPHALSPAVAAILGPVFELAAETGFAFDPAIGALSDAWGIHEQGRIPTPEAQASARSATGVDAFFLDPAAATISRNRSAARLDVGGFGKGAALDRAAAALRGRGVSSARLDLGGQVLVLGGPFPIALAHPERRDDPIAVLDLTNASISTSGNSERAIVTASGSIGHILDPRTGAPATFRGSVTVIAPTALEADVLSTALYVLGPEPGIRLARSRPGVEALFVEATSGGQIALHFTPGMGHRLRAVAPGLVTATPAGPPELAAR
jgi:thiamine biosynthesis lipoprotein